MRWWDVETLLPLERELFGPSAWSAETFWSELAHQDTRWYVVHVEDGDVEDGDVEDGPDCGNRTGERVLGYAGLLAPGMEADIQTVAVAPSAQGRGIGRILVRALVAEAARREATSLLLEVRADNAAAIRLYTACGFERIAVRRRYYQPEDADAWVMRLRPLRPPPDGSAGHD